MEEHLKKLRLLARLGYGSRGVLYLIIGGLAFLAAIDSGGGVTNSKGALREIMSQPFGDFLLVVMIIGLFCYSGWRLTQVIQDPDSHGKSGKGLSIRGAMLVSAITHVLLAFSAISLLTGIVGDSGQSRISEFLRSGIGQGILIVVGILVIIAGGAHLHKGWTAGFAKYMDIPADKRKWAHPICRIGLIARGIVMGLIGWFIFRSAWLTSSGETKGIVDALNSLRSADYGSWLLAIVAMGLVAFGAYSILEAIYRRIEIGTD